MHRIVSGRFLKGKRGRSEFRHEMMQEREAHLRNSRMGSEMRCSRTPGGSTILRHRMVDTYCVMMSVVSAPGCKSRLMFLSTSKWI